MAKRFLLCYDFLNEMGGLEKLMTVHAKFLKDSGYRVKLLFGDIDPELAKNEAFKDLELEEYGSKKLKGPIKLIGGILGVNNLKEIIQPDDILVSYSFPMNITLRKFNNLKILYLNHYPNFLYLPLSERWVWANNIKRKVAFCYSLVLGPITKKLDKKYVKNNSLIFVNSIFTKNKLDSLYDINGVMSYPPVHRQFVPTINIKKEKPYLFSSGRIIPDKNFDWLIQAFSKIKDKDIELHISGKGDKKEIDRLIDISVELGVRDRVRFIGFVTTKELIQKYSNAEAYIFPTAKEDFGLCTAEALSCGCPIITWGDGGGSCEQTIEEVNGYKATPYELSDFALCIDKCLNDNFKETNKKEILESSKVFGEEYQQNIFVIAINNTLNKNNI